MYHLLTCEVCEKPLKSKMAKTCSQTCRQKKHRIKLKLAAKRNGLAVDNGVDYHAGKLSEILLEKMHSRSFGDRKDIINALCELENLCVNIKHCLKT